MPCSSPLQVLPCGCRINHIMIDLQHDSPVPIHEQITKQLREHIASGALKAGAHLAEYRAFAQELLTNPQVVARAYADLEWEGVLKKAAGGSMEVTGNAAFVCRAKLQEIARQRLRHAVAQALTAGLVEAEIHESVAQELAAARAEPLSSEQVRTAIQKPSHESRHRNPQAIQDLSRQVGPGSP
jgi:GntR family transcriptional regulator